MVGVLFVCTGNICRSPTAEGVMRAMVARAGLADRIAIASAATHDYHCGDPPDPRTIRHALKRGYDLSAQRARRIETADFDRFDLMLACDRGHHAIITRLAPSKSRARISMFLDYAPDLNLAEVPDPYYGGPADFERVLDIVEHAAAKVLDALKEDFILSSGPSPPSRTR